MIWNDEAQLWLPNESQKMDKCWRFIKRNVHDLDAGIAWVRKPGIAVQAGGHVGIFPNYLAGHFIQVLTFEPDPELYPCLLRNRRPRVTAFPYALSNTSGTAFFKSAPGGTGALDKDGMTPVETVTIDECGQRVNFIHLDIEGGEVNALRGAQMVIARDQPVIQLEILPRFKDEIYAFMETIDYKVVNDTRRDHVFTRDGK